MKTEITFDDFGSNGSLAIVDESGNYEWIEPQIGGIPSESCVRLALVPSEGSGDYDARKALREYLLRHYQIDVACDFRDKSAISRAMTEATAVRDRFLSGNYARFRA